MHDNVRHTSHFVVIGNHLAQHPTLSALAIGLGVHIQSLPKGAQVDIKSLAVRFPCSSRRPWTCSRTSAAMTPGCCCRPSMPTIWPRESPPGWSVTSPPAPYGTP